MGIGHAYLGTMDQGQVKVDAVTTCPSSSLRITTPKNVLRARVRP
jgi:hypothetical protein